MIFHNQYPEESKKKNEFNQQQRAQGAVWRTAGDFHHSSLLRIKAANSGRNQEPFYFCSSLHKVWYHRNQSVIILTTNTNKVGPASLEQAGRKVENQLKWDENLKLLIFEKKNQILESISDFSIFTTCKSVAENIV